MSSAWITALPVGLVAITALALLIAQDWRVNLALIAFQYLGVFLLVAMVWPLPMAMVKLIAGWVAAAVLGIAMAGLPASAPSGGRRTRWSSFILHPSSFLYSLASLLVGIVAYSGLGNLETWFPGIPPGVAFGGLLLIGLGLLKLGFNHQVLPVTLGLLTVLSGFEVLYASAQTSLLLAGLLAGVSLGLAWVGAYLINAPSVEATE